VEVYNFIISNVKSKTARKVAISIAAKERRIVY
jgi:hypothetical protein